jgi:hypothetical protein
MNLDKEVIRYPRLNEMLNRIRDKRHNTYPKTNNPEYDRLVRLHVKMYKFFWSYHAWVVSNI